MKKKILNISLFLIISLIFVDIVRAETYTNFDTSALRSCGNGYLEGIPGMLPKVISIIYTIIQIAVPVVLVIMGMLDLFKAVTAQKEDEMTKARKMLVKRLIYAVLVFFVMVVVKLVVSVADNDNKAKILDCAECFITNKCDN